MDPDSDPGGPKTCRSCGSGSPALPRSMTFLLFTFYIKGQEVGSILWNYEELLLNMEIVKKKIRKMGGTCLQRLLIFIPGSQQTCKYHLAV
jgi:hypothetical protein